jgi:hypothetical protein
VVRILDWDNLIKSELKKLWSTISYKYNVEESNWNWKKKHKLKRKKEDNIAMNRVKWREVK